MSTPKVVRFKDEFTNPVKPTVLEERLKEEVRKEGENESPRFRVRPTFEDDDDYVPEMSRQELEERISKRKEPNNSDYNMGRRLRSNERLNSSEREYERNQASNEAEFERPKRIKKVQIEPAAENRFTNTGRTTPPRNFQMKNIIKENPSIRPVESRFSTNNTIPEISSKYEESRDDTSIYNRSENSLAHNHPRSRSPFNVSHHQNTSYVKENVEIRNSPRRVNPPPYEEIVYYPSGQADDVLQQKSNVYNMPQKIVKRESDGRISSPRVSNFESRSPRHSSPRMSNEGRISYQRDITPTHIRQEQRLVEEYPEDKRVNRHPSPRERPMGSPRRNGKKRDARTEMNILSRFLANKITGRKVEDMIFDLVYEVMQEAKNPRKKQIVEYQPPYEEPPRRIKQKEPNFEFERKKDQSHKEAVRSHNKELIQMMDRMEEEEGNLSETEDTDEKSRVNPITQTIEKKETKNHYVKRRVVDSLGIKFENANKVNGVKSVPYQDNNNYPMIDVRSNLTRQKHEI